ncbi:hypothetical protein EPO56_00870 [Patescibacteria group bacterium]|nr:MAG: hypothetical protein EPO56_00870 [Patescibacteria group bacterium]
MSKTHRAVLNFFAVILGVVTLVGSWVFHDPSLARLSFLDPVLNSGPSIPQEWEIHLSSKYNLALRYPPGYAVDPSYVYTQIGDKSGMRGIKFSIPETITSGTNLSADSGVSIEVLPKGLPCSGSEFVYQGLAIDSLTDQGVDYSVVKTAQSAAGNLYEEIVYVIKESKPCTAVRYFFHSTQLANYPSGEVRQFDKRALLKDFDTVRRSLSLTR